MKKLILFLSLILSVGFASAQSEIPSDSILKDSPTLFLRLLTPGLPVLDTDMVGDCLLLHSLCRWDLSN